MHQPIKDHLSNLYQKHLAPTLFRMGLGRTERQDAPSLAAAVSGGPDSLALTLLLEKWVTEFGGTLTLLTVDHQLRPEAALEAQWVANWAQKRGLTHQTLTWTEAPLVRSRLQEKARHARYTLLEKACLNKNIPYLFFGHHLGDSLETFLMQLHRKKEKFKGASEELSPDFLLNLNYLSPADALPKFLGSQSIPRGIPEKTILSSFPPFSLKCLRPLLDVNPKYLREMLHHENVPFFEDPSNNNLKFERVRYRHFLKNLSEKDHTALHQKLILSSELHMIQRKQVENFCTRALTVAPEGFGFFSREEFLKEPSKIQIEILRHLLWRLSGHTYPPKYESTNHLQQAISCSTRQHTLHGCCIVLKGNRVFIGRELRHITPQLLKIGNQVWDQRFYLHNSGKQENIWIGPMALDMPHLKKWRHRFPDIPYAIACSTPCLSLGSFGEATDTAQPSELVSPEDLGVTLHFRWNHAAQNVSKKES